MGIIKKPKPTLNIKEGDAVGKDGKKYKVTKLADGAFALEGEIPAGIDLSDPVQAQEFAKKALADAGILPEGLNIQPKPVDKGTFDELLDKLKSGKANKDTFRKAEEATLREGLNRAGDGSTEDIVLKPQDPLKANFVQCLNHFHKELHKLAVAAKDVLAATDALESFSQTTPKAEQASFNHFKRDVIDCLLKLNDTGHLTCELVNNVERAGIPLRDSTSTTVN